MASKLYAVRKGYVPGIYMTWPECEVQVKGYKGAEYKSFTDATQAAFYMAGMEQAVTTVDASKSTPVKHSKKTGKVSTPVVTEESTERVPVKNSSNHACVFVDGSYNSSTNEYGYGVYINHNGKERVMVGRGPCQAGGRNVEGEVAASRAAIKSISEENKDIKSITLYHDYQGIGSWADGDWKANKAYTREYQQFVKNARDNGLEIKFEHVDGHTGVEGNEYVDKLAKIACDVPLTASEREFISKLSNLPGYPSKRELPTIDIDVSDSKDNFEF